MSYRSEVEEVRSLPYMPSKWQIVTEDMPKGFAVEVSHGGDHFTPLHYSEGIPEKVAKGWVWFQQGDLVDGKYRYKDIRFNTFDEAKEFIVAFVAFLEWMNPKVVIKQDEIGVFATVDHLYDVLIDDSLPVPQAFLCNCKNALDETVCYHMRVVNAYYQKIAAIFSHEEEVATSLASEQKEAVSMEAKQEVIMQTPSKKSQAKENHVKTLKIDEKELEVLEISTSNAAKELKADFKSVFGKYYPGLRFSVKATTSGYKPILEINWTDGPTYNEVKKVAEKFIGRDEEERPIINQSMFMHNNRPFVYRVAGISLRHSFSDPERERQAIARVYQS